MSLLIHKQVSRLDIECSGARWVEKTRISQTEPYKVQFALTSRHRKSSQELRSEFGKIYIAQANVDLEEPTGS